MSWYFVCVWYPQKPEKRMKFSGIRITDSCEVSHGCWNSNLGPLEKYQVLLTAESSLRPPNGIL